MSSLQERYPGKVHDRPNALLGQEVWKVKVAKPLWAFHLTSDPEQVTLSIVRRVTDADEVGWRTCRYPHPPGDVTPLTIHPELLGRQVELDNGAPQLRIGCDHTLDLHPTGAVVQRQGLPAGGIFVKLEAQGASEGRRDQET